MVVRIVLTTAPAVIIIFYYIKTNVLHPVRPTLTRLMITRKLFSCFISIYFIKKKLYCLDVSLVIVPVRRVPVQIVHSVFLVVQIIIGTMATVLKTVRPITMVIYNNVNVLNVRLVVRNAIKLHVFPVWMIGRLIVKVDVYRMAPKSAVQV